MPIPTFMHLDLDQFFVAAERLRDPSLVGRPVCVGGDDPRMRGAVACASYEARAFGVRSGQALRQAHALCPQAVFVSGDPSVYLELSRQVRELLEGRAPRVVPRSIDEFDVELTGCERLLGSLPAYARRLQAEVLAATGLSCSVGVAGTPLVAKVAAGHEKPAGFVAVPPGGEAAFLAPLPIRTLPGVGPVSEAQLIELGVRTVGELAALDPELLRRALGGRGLELGLRARGGVPRLPKVHQSVGSFSVGWGLNPAQAGPPPAAHPETVLPRSLSRERTFATDQDDRTVLDAALVRLVESAACSLRTRKLAAKTLCVGVRYADLVDTSHRRRLPKDPDEAAWIELARQLLARLLRRRLRIRRLRVAFHGIRLRPEQRLLFEGEPDTRNRQALGNAMDSVRAKHGWEALRWASGFGSTD